MTLVQALPRGQQGVGTVGFNAAAFQSKVDALTVGMRKHALRGQCCYQSIILAGLELAPPSGEAEVEQAEVIAVAQGDRARAE